LVQRSHDKRSLPVVTYGNSSGITDELDGRMDKFKLYDIALTSEEIQNIYNNEKGFVIDEKACENLSIVYEVNGQSDTGDSEIIVNEGDDVSLYLSSDEVDFITIAPDGSILNINLIENITTAQSGLYTIYSPLSEFQQPDNTTISFVDSEELTHAQSGSATNAIDGNTSTFWHTEWFTTTKQYPHEIQIDYGEPLNVLGFEYLPRQDGSLNGTIANYEIYVSNSTTNWGTSVASGTWAYNNDLKTVYFSEKQGRYLRLVALSEGGGNPWASAAELRGLTEINQCVKTIQINVENPITYIYTNNAWLPIDPNGVATTIDTIKINDGEATIASNTSCKNLIIEPGAALTVDSGVTLITNKTTLNSTSLQYSSLIVDGDVTGEVSYNRYVNVIGTSSGGGNDLISSPVENATFNAAFVIANPNLAQNLNNFGEFAFAPFNVSAGAYQNYDIGLYRTEVFPLISGSGYRAATLTGGALTFTGSVSNSNLAIAISDAVVGNAWNLIGNPYPSYIDAQQFFTSNNIGQFHNQYVAIFGYNGSQGGWETYNLATSNELIAPGQGFFVKAKSGGGIIQFTPEMRRSGTSDDFILGRQEDNTLKALSKIKLSNGNTTVKASIYFIEGTTRGLDLGYDAAVYSATSINFSLFTNLLEDNIGLDIAIQSLPYSDFNDVIVPLGIKATSGSELIISIDELSTIPSNVNVYLEDTQNNTLTLLNNNDFSFTPMTNLNGTGRFYLRYSTGTLSVSNIKPDYLQIYTTINPKSLLIKGHLNSATEMNLFDIQGRLVLNEKLNHFDTTNVIDISTLSTGVYIVKVFNESQVKTQKLIIK
jgi:hypothetical protein